MDSRTQRALSKITWGTPRDLAHKLMKKVVDTTDEEKAQQALRSNKLDAKTKESLRKMIDSGSLRKESEIVDESVVKKLNAYNDNEIRKAIKRGDLADPKTDNFIKDRQRKIQQHANSGTTGVRP